MIFDVISFIALFTIMFVAGTDIRGRNFFIAFMVSTIILLEILSISFLRKNIDECFLFFLMNIEIFNLALSTKIMVLYYFMLFFIILVFASYMILKRIQIRRYRKFILSVCLFVLFLPSGFFYDILHILIVDYGVSYYKYKDETYQDIFKMIKHENYVTKDELNILNTEEKHKNIVLIYLESFDQSYLSTDFIKKYSQHLQKLAKENEFYGDMEQINECWGTVPGIFCSQCGVQFSSYFLVDNPYESVNKTQLVCLPDVLSKANYIQVFLGGADKKLFNKGNYLYSHSYDIVYDKNSLLKKKPALKYRMLDWGIADYDIFDFAKQEYINLSKQNRPFNLTILTTSTHSPNGVYDKRCENSSDEQLLSSIECTDMLIKNFIEFLKTQKNFKDTVVIILPDHIQFAISSVNNKINHNNEKLYFIMLNGITFNNEKPYKSVNYTNLASIFLKELNVNSNANFFNYQDDNVVIKNFIYKIHKDNYNKP
jgi:phosphoglycerol transferase MdoB-like AlkP superfamily enzyme